MAPRAATCGISKAARFRPRSFSFSLCGCGLICRCLPNADLFVLLKPSSAGSCS
jgi:hypothetical protein